MRGRIVSLTETVCPGMTIRLFKRDAPTSMLLLRLALLVLKLVVQLPARTKSELVTTLPFPVTCVNSAGVSSCVMSLHAPVRIMLRIVCASQSGMDGTAS